MTPGMDVVTARRNPSGDDFPASVGPSAAQDENKAKFGNQNNRGDLKQPFQDIPGALVRKFLMSERLNSHQL